MPLNRSCKLWMASKETRTMTANHNWLIGWNFGFTRFRSWLMPLRKKCKRLCSTCTPSLQRKHRSCLWQLQPSSLITNFYILIGLTFWKQAPYSGAIQYWCYVSILFICYKLSIFLPGMISERKKDYLRISTFFVTHKKAVMLQSYPTRSS